MVLVGLPGSGKSTYLANLGVNAISSDELRRLLADNPEDQTIHRRVFASIRYLLSQRLATGRKITYVDATHLTRRDRRPYIRFAQLHDCQVEALFFDVPLEICRERNRSRSRIVPESAMDDMAKRMSLPTVEEGFDQVTIYNEGWPNSR